MSKRNSFFYFELLKCVYNCSIRERQNKICITNYVSSNQEDDYDIFDIIINQIKNELTNNFDESVINGNPIKEKETKIILTKTDNQGNDTILNLTLCEERLKYAYNITKNESLYLLRIDTEQDGMKTSSFNYELYFPNNSNNLEQLNLSICQDIKIDIIIQINLTENLDKYNLKSGYYNDICYTADSDYGTDIILSDRKKEYFDNNYSICEINCDFVSKNIKIDKNVLKSSFTDIINIINYKIIFCYKTIFNPKSLIKNIGFFIYVGLIFFNLICLLIFLIQDFKKLIMNIKEIKLKTLNFNENNNALNKKQLKNKNNDVSIAYTNKLKKNKNGKQHKKFINHIISDIHSPPNKKKNKKNKNNKNNFNANKISASKKTKFNLNTSKMKSNLDFLDNKKEIELKQEIIALNYKELNSLNLEEAIIKDKEILFNIILHY